MPVGGKTKTIIDCGEGKWEAEGLDWKDNSLQHNVPYYLLTFCLTI